MQYGLSSETLYTSALLIPIPYIDSKLSQLFETDREYADSSLIYTVALNNLHNGGQVPLFPPQTLLTSPIASFPNSVATAEQAESSTTPELVFVSYPTAAEPNIEEQESNSPSRDSGSTSSEAGNREPGEQELETLLDLWMVAKLREASTSLASLISNLYPNQFLPSATRPSVSTASEGWRDAPARIRSWVTNRACSWLDICSQSTHAQLDNHLSSQDTLNRPWAEGKSNPSEWAEDGRVLSEIPSYVLEHAPYVHLFSKEKYWPSDIAAHLNHITPKLNYTPMLPSSEHPTLTNLDELNQWEQGLNVYLTSNEDVETNPDWLESRINIPQPLPGDDGNKSPRTESGHLFDDADVREHDEDSEAEPPGGDTGVDADAENSSGWPRKRPPRREPGRSEAPAVLIVVEKGEGIVDAFWFYFYSFNQGNQVLNVRFGSHVGDWEHTLVRFENGTPTTVFCSEHSFGEAFTYNAAEKIGKRVCSKPLILITMDVFTHKLNFSLSSIPLQAHMPCTRAQGSTITSSPSDSSTTKQIGAHCGIPP